MIEAANKTLISKTTGISLFLMAVAAGIGYGWAFGGFYVADNPAATAGNLAQAPFALYAAVISFTVVLILGITVSLTLYVLYRHVNQKQALWVSGLRLAYSAVLAVALYRLASTAGVLDVLTEQSVAAMEHLDAFLTIWSFGLIVFGVRLFVPSLLLKKKNRVQNGLAAALCCRLLLYVFSFAQPVFSCIRTIQKQRRSGFRFADGIGRIGICFSASVSVQKTADNGMRRIVLLPLLLETGKYIRPSENFSDGLYATVVAEIPFECVRKVA